MNAPADRTRRMMMLKPNSLVGRRDFLLASAIAGAAGALLPVAAHAETDMSSVVAESLARAAVVAPAAKAGGAAAIGVAAGAFSEDDPSIRPFRFHASDEILADLHRRIVATRWPEP